ncbi:hypothetical protein F5B20DRAFT_363816 [Whalleya microplaca]|nr:hypothetical protein F5B20DRAFT_363816 [Whalleya microplaca]
MQLTTLLLTTAFSATAVLAAPFSMAAEAEWTIESLSRNCTATDTSCLWIFGINVGAEGVNATACSYGVNATEAAPASQAIGGPVACGNYTVTSTWSGQFGEGEGFTTLSVIDYDNKLIVYPAYKDTQVASGEVVSPDQSYPVQNLP